MKSQQPFISIIIPVYNGSEFLSDAIDSALKQSYSNYEIIVVNDGSCDDGKTRACALKYGDKIRYFEKVNGGTGSALNYGIKRMNGDYFAWLSHDDKFLPQKLERQVEFINRIIQKYNADPKRCIFTAAIEQIDENNRRLRSKISAKKKEIASGLDILCNFGTFGVAGCTVLVPKEAFNEIGMFNNDLKTVQDTDFWCRLLLAGYSFCYQKEVLVQMRLHKKQASVRMHDYWLDEIDSFYSQFIRNVWDREEYRRQEIFRSIFYYCTIRNMDNASKAAKEFVLHLTSGSGHLSFRLCQLRVSFKRKYRETARNIYRSIVIKG